MAKKHNFKISLKTRHVGYQKKCIDLLTSEKTSLVESDLQYSHKWPNTAISVMAVFTKLYALFLKG